MLQLALTLALCNGVLAADQVEVGMTPASGDSIQEGIDLIYNLQLEEADVHFREQVIASRPDRPAGHFFRAMVSWWRILIDLADDSHDEEFYRRIEACIRVCDRRLQHEPLDFDAILYKGGAIGFRGRLRGDRGHYLRAAQDGLRCLPLLERSRQLEPANRDILFGQGIYNYFAAVIPRQIPVVRPLMVFLPDGDRQVGLQQLHEVVRNGHYARAEACYFLAQIFTLYEDDPGRAARHLEHLNRLYPANAVFHLRLARANAEIGRWRKAVFLYREWEERSQARRTGYHVHGRLEALYYLGRNAFYRRRLEEAAQFFGKVDSLGSGSERERDRQHVALANLMLGMTRDLQGRRQQAIQRYDRVCVLTGEGESHALAQKYRREPYGGGP